MKTLYFPRITSVLLILFFIPIMKVCAFSTDKNEQQKKAEQKDQVPEIVTDRPDVTESSIVIPKGSLQAENGFTRTNRQANHSFDLSETLLRLGIGQRTELRFVVPNFTAISGLPEHTHTNGFEDLAVGFKQQLGPLPGKVDLSVIAEMSLPTGTSGLSSHAIDPEIKFPWSKDLKNPYSIGGMFSFFLPTEDGKRNFTWEETFYFERELRKNMDLFIEYAGDYPHIGKTSQILHMGYTYRSKPTRQLDFHFGIGLTKAAPIYFIACGYSFRIDKLF